MVRERVEATKYATWFAPLKPLSGAVGMLRIAVPNKFVRDWLVEHYHELITETLQECTGVPYQVFFVVQEPAETVADAEPPESAPVNGAARPPQHRAGIQPAVYLRNICGGVKQSVCSRCLSGGGTPSGTHL